jgi:hypothetical protein
MSNFLKTCALHAHCGSQLEEDLTTRNHMYQKTTRILVYKLRGINFLKDSSLLCAHQGLC